MEIWKDIQNYEGYYQVSNQGRVRSIDRYVKTSLLHNECKLVKGKILKANKKNNGYYSVDLCKKQIIKTISIHKLVALAFLENNDLINKTQVDHINGNKADNRVENLEWVTPKENKQRAEKNGLCKNHNQKAFICVELNKTFKSSYDAAQYINEKYFKNSKQIKNVASKIRCCASGFQSKAYNFTWKKL